MPRRRKSGILWRAALTALLLLPAALPMADYNWCLYDLVPYNAETEAHPEYISAPVAPWAYTMTDWMWRIFPGAIEMMAAALAAIGLFIMLGGRRASLRLETRCGHCATILRNLTEAKCPNCGQAL